MTDQQTRQEVEKLIFQIVRNKLTNNDEQELTAATNFGKDLNADSLDTVETVMEMEDSCLISFSDAEAEQMTTIGRTIASVCLKLVAEGRMAESELTAEDLAFRDERAAKLAAAEGETSSTTANDEG